MDLPHHPAVLVRSAARLPDEARRVRLVHAHHRVVLLRQRHDLVQLGQVAVHREHAVRHDHIYGIQSFFHMYDIWYAIIKTVVFAFLIASFRRTMVIIHRAELSK